jgi:glucosamine kinase
VGALGDQDGFLLSVGTGTIVASTKSGTFSFIGGWGFQMSDQGSGAWLGQKALRRTILCHDRLSPHSDLTRGLMAHFDNDPNEIVTFAATAQPGDYGALAPRVIDAAAEQDEWGKKIVQDGADYLVKALLNLGFKSGDTLCLVGGVGPHYAPYLPQDTLAGRIASKGSALDGAFQLAKRHALNMQGSPS